MTPLEFAKDIVDCKYRGQMKWTDVPNQPAYIDLAKGLIRIGYIKKEIKNRGADWID